MRYQTALVLLVISALAFAGCPRDNSCNLRTAGIYCTFRVAEENGQATATAVFSVGNAAGTELTLGDCGDNIAVNGTPLQERRGLFVYYEGLVDVADTYEFVFTRQDEGPYTCLVSPPPPVAITAPAEGTPLTRKEAFDIQWDNNYAESAGIGLVIAGPCITGIVRPIGDNGLYTINASELQASPETAACDVNILLTRTVSGKMDPGLKGAITAAAVDRTWFTSNP